MPNPLHALHESAGAEFQAYADIDIVTTFGHPQAEYSTVRTGTGLIDLPQRGLIEVTGKDRLLFLNNLLTNQTWDKEKKAGMPAGTGVYAFFLNNKGRIVCDVNVLELGDRCLLETDARLIPPFADALQKYIFAEQVKVTPRTEELHEIALHGPGAPTLLSELTGGSTSACGEQGRTACGEQSRTVPLTNGASLQFQFDTTPIIAWRDDITGTPGFNLIIPADRALFIWQSLLDKFAKPPEHQPAKLRLRPFGWAVFNTTRIEAGRPLFGIDFDDNILPAETGQMARAVSLTKGCYLGQEIVARMHARNQVARQIVGIRINEDALPLAGSPIMDAEGNTIGGITSSTVSPILSNACIALGLVKKPFIPPETPVRVAAEGGMRNATIVKTPFVQTAT
ncbi:MAG TPA: glycine cleavage T C-terminal barrel domain-containing protein [Tepidisphaeraceae bacterium]|jgi:aminomethyltransferase